jgi:hypothetical protein
MLTYYNIVGEKDEILETFCCKEFCDIYWSAKILPLTTKEKEYWRVEKCFMDEIIRIERYKEGHFFIETTIKCEPIAVIISNAELAQWLFIAQDYTSFKDIPKEHRKQCREANKIAKKLIRQVVKDFNTTGIFQPHVKY